MKLKSLKKIYLWFFTILVFTILSACVNETLIGQEPINPDNQTDNYFLSLDITPNTIVESRAATGEGESSDYYDENGTNKETGQSWENEVNEVIVILATTNDNNNVPDLFLGAYNANKTAKTLTVTDNENLKYRAYLTLSYEEVKNLETNANVQSNGTFKASIYLICNPTNNIKASIASLKSRDNLQQILKISSTTPITDFGGFLYNQSNNNLEFKNFLMTNGDYLNQIEDQSKDKYLKEIEMTKIYAATSPAVAYNLNPKGGSIPVQRVLARFDINPIMPTAFFDEKGNYLGKNEINNNNWKTSITMEYIGLANISSNFNLFKESGLPLQNGIKGTKNTDWGYFWSEVDKSSTSTNYRYVLDPQYINKRNLLLSSTYDPLNEYFLQNVFDYSWLAYEDSYDNDSESTESRHKANRPFQKISNLNNNKFGSAWTNNNHDDNYKVWRYCTPNSIHETDMQKNGISTGVIFVARMNFNNGFGFGVDRGSATPIYVWKGVRYWTNRNVQNVVAQENKTSDEKAMAEAYLKAIESATEKDEIWLNASKVEWNTSTDLEHNECYKAMNTLPSAALSKALVENGFSIYVPIDMQGDGIKEYMCFYYFWNKHNENNNENEMGPMEFAVVRNNIYQLTVEDILKIGHPLPIPGIETEPDPITPDTDDEEPNDNYLSIAIKVLAWAKRDITVTW